MLKYKSDQYLDRLDRILNFDLDSYTPGFLLFLPNLTSQTWILLSIIATPYIVWILMKKRRIGWIVTFIIMVLIPWLLAAHLLTYFEMGYIFYSLPLLLHFIYLFMLKQSYRDWREPLIIDKRTSKFYKK